MVAKEWVKWYDGCVKNKPSQMSRQLKKIGIEGGITIRRKGEWERDRPPKEHVAGKPKKKGGGKSMALSKDVKMQLAKDRASGMSQRELAEKYSISETYVNNALASLFVQSAKAREVLKGVLYNNAIAAGMKVRHTIGELTPMQAVITTGIMTQRAIDLERHTATTTQEVDFSELAGVGDLLRDLRGQVALPSDMEGDIIDIQAENVD